MKVPEILYKAQRQYRHNYGNDELIPAFDYHETIKIVNELEAKVNQLQNTSSNSKYTASQATPKSCPKCNYSRSVYDSEKGFYTCCSCSIEWA